MDSMLVSADALKLKWGSLAASLEVSLVACVIGFFLPAYYDWSGADQSRPSPWIPFAFAVLGIVVTLVGLILGLRHFYWRIPSAAGIKHGGYPLLFAVCTLGVLTAIHATGLRTVVLILSFVALAVVVAWGCCQAYQHVRLRWALATLLFSCYGPLLWIVVGKHSQNSIPQASLFLLGAPMLMPAGLLGMVLGVHLQELMWLGNSLTMIAIAIGIALMHLGEKRALAYTLSLLVVSAAGSMVFHSLIRA